MTLLPRFYILLHALGFIEDTFTIQLVPSEFFLHESFACNTHSLTMNNYSAVSCKKQVETLTNQVLQLQKMIFHV